MVLYSEGSENGTPPRGPAPPGGPTEDLLGKNQILYKEKF